MNSWKHRIPEVQVARECYNKRKIENCIRNIFLRIRRDRNASF